MGLTIPAIIGLAGVVVGGVGAGMSYAAQKDAANTQAAFGLMNAQASAQQARQQGKQQMLSAEIQAASLRAQGRSAQNNAAGIVAQTEAESRAATENIRRDRDAFARTLGQVRANASNSGVLETTGSPLDFLVAASEDEQLYESEQRWADENNRRQGFRRAEIERSGASQLGLNATLSSIEGASSMAAGRMGATQARLDGYAAKANAAGMRSSANAGLVSNFGQLGMSSYQMYQNRTPRR